MTRLPEIRDAIEKSMKRSRVYSLSEIYDMVNIQCNLDKEDFDPQAPGSNQPKWKRNVRNGLQKMKDKNVDWRGGGLYLRI